MTVPFTVKRIDHLVLRVLDLPTSIAFYHSVLGCTLEWQRDDLGLAHLRAGDALIDLVSVDGMLGARGGLAPAIEGRNLEHLCLRIDPFDESALLEHLQHHGLRPLSSSANTDDNVASDTSAVQVNYGAEGFGFSLYIADPDGNVVELKGPPRAAEQ